MIFLFIAILSATPLTSSGKDVFLRGRYIEVGIHNVASYGTDSNPPSGFKTSSHTGRWSKGLGFTADWAGDGWSTFAGDYFLPGSPLEGWSIEYQDSPTGGETVNIMKGRVGRQSFGPSSFEMTSKAWEPTMADQLNTAVWIGTGGKLKVSKSIQFRTDKKYFTTKVTLKNTGSSKMHNVEYMRNVDPDQGQPHGCGFGTYNYVKYQPFATGDPTGFVKTGAENTALVIAHSSGSCSPMTLGLGTVHPKARVNHFGFQNNDADAVIGNSPNTQWKSYSESKQHFADQGINLAFRFEELEAGESVSFAFAYVLSADDLEEAMDSINALIMVQPTEAVGGTSVLFSCKLAEAVSGTKMSFYVTRSGTETKVGTANVPTSTGGSLYQVMFDSTGFSSQPDYEFKCSADTGSTIHETSKVIGIDNGGPEIEFTLPSKPSGSSAFGFSNAGATKVRVSNPTGVSSVKFFRETMTIGGIESKLVITDTSAPWEAEVDVSDLIVGIPITIKAVASDSGGRQGFATFSGIVSEPSEPPTNILLSSTVVVETSTVNVNIGVLSSVDPNSGDSHTYRILSGDHLVGVVGSNLVVKGNFDYEAGSTRNVKIQSEDSTGLTFDKSFTLTVTDVNEPPYDITASSSSIDENTLSGTKVADLSAKNPESKAGQSVSWILINSDAGRFSLSGASVVLVGDLDFETQSQRTIEVRAVDSGSPAEFDSKSLHFKVNDVNEPPTLIELSQYSIKEQCPETECTDFGSSIKVADITCRDPEGLSQAHSYTLRDDGGGRFKISGSELQLATTSVNPLDYEETSSVTIQIRSTDNGSPPKFRDQFILINVEDVAEAPVVNPGTCEVDENKPDDSFVCRVAATNTQNDIALDFQIIGGNANKAFKINNCSGIIFVNKGSELDFEDPLKKKYSLTIQVEGGVKSTLVLVPDLPFQNKWYATMSLPIFSAAILAMVWFCILCFKLLCKRKKKWRELNTHASRIIATFTLLFYYMYLSLTRTALRVFNCKPAVPDDGFMYTDFTDLSCQGGLCRCDIPGGLQASLKAPAALGLIVYSLGYPAFILFILKIYKNRIKEDQLLRAAEIGDDRKTSTSNETYTVRKRWHKLYYHFKPGKTYWIFIIVNRKLWIAVAGLMFRSSPGFQLSFVLMILFASYVLQVQHRPYMSSAERNMVLQEHLRKAGEGDRFHRRMKPIMEAAILTRDKQRAQAAIRKKQASLRGWAKSNVGSVGSSFGVAVEDNANYFWDYNTVEATLLACAVFVCLSGVMFESSQFENRPDLVWMQDMIGILVAIVLLYSGIYYLAVFVSEISGRTPACVEKCCADKKKAHFAEHRNGSGFMEDAERSIEFAEIRHIGDSTTKAELEATAAELAKVNENNRKLVNMMRQQKAQKDSGLIINPLAKKRGKRKKLGKVGRERKKEYSPMRVAKDVSNDRPETLGVELVLPSEDSVVNNPLPIAKKRKTHRSHQTADGKIFYEDILTGTTTWDLPDTAII